MSTSSYTYTAILLHLILLLDMGTVPSWADECQLTPVIHVLQYPGCVPKPIPSFACMGKCTSYVQVINTRAIVLYVTERLMRNDERKQKEQKDTLSRVFFSSSFFVGIVRVPLLYIHCGVWRRFPVRNSGRLNEVASVVKRVANARQQSLFSAPRHQRENPNSDG